MMVATALRRLEELDVLVLTALIWFLGKFVRYAFPPLFETLGSSYGVSRTVLGTAFTGFMIVYAAMQFPSGLLADTHGAVGVIAAGSLLTTVGALALVVDAPFFVLAGAMIVMGAGTGTYKTVAVRLLSRTYPARTGRVLGVFDTFGTFGGVAAPAAVVLVAGFPSILAAPWRWLFLGAALASVGLAAGFTVRIGRRSTQAVGRTDATKSPSDATETESGHESPNDSGHLGTYLALFRAPRFTGFVVVTVLFGFAYNGTVAFLPLYLTSETPLTAVTANLLYSAMFVASLSQMATGEASDRIGTIPILSVTLGVAAAGLTAILVFGDAGGPLVIGAAVVTLGLGAHGFRPVRGAYLMELVPDAVAAGSFGIVRTVLMGAGAVAPAIIGYLSEVAGFRVAFEVLAGTLVSATVLMVLLWVVAR
ncbi:MFS transporter [Halanaeroarchaeum sulfurireducens]